MFFDRMFNDTNAPVLERVLEFTAQRHRLIAQNVVNISTPGYRQQDLSVEKFQEMLAHRVEDRRSGIAGSFDEMQAEIANPRNGILFHDGQTRSMEQLMSDQAKNAMVHNLVIELLRKQFQTMEMALKDKPV